MASKKPVISKYDPAMCERIVELGRLGFTQKAMWSDIGISKSTADKWRKDNPDFAEAVSRATTESQAWWEREGMANLSNRTYNTRLYDEIKALARGNVETLAAIACFRDHKPEFLEITGQPLTYGETVVDYKNLDFGIRGPGFVAIV